MSYRSILSIFGTLLTLTAGCMVLPLLFALYFQEGDAWPIFLSILIALGLGVPLWFFFRKHRNLKIKDGFIVVTFGWIIMASVSALPFMIHGSIPSFTDSFFEIMSGLTTTGATILDDIEALPHGLLFWRQMTHFIGGMGIIMLSILILPMLGIQQLQLYKAEASPGLGPESQKLSPRIQQSAKWLWLIYIGINLLLILFYWVGGMSLYDAICHAFSTISTGGYSTRGTSMAYFDSSFLDWITCLFMFLGGMNFVLHYNLIRGDWQSLRENTELQWYILLVFFFCGTIALILWLQDTYSSFGEALRYGSFQVISIITTTGYATADYTSWPVDAQMIIFMSLFAGACSGSTSSGIKIIQMVVLWKYLHTKIKKFSQPLAIVPITVNGHRMSQEAVGGVLGYFVLSFFFVFWGGALLSLITNLDVMSSFTAIIATSWNIGPGFGQVGPSENFGHITDAGKWLLSFAMLAGRLDMFTVLVMFYPSFWRK